MKNKSITRFVSWLLLAALVCLSLPTVTLAADEATASVTLGANSVVGTAGNTTVTFNITEDDLEAGATVSFTLPANLDLTDLAYASDTFGSGDWNSCVVGIANSVTCTTTLGMPAQVGGTIVLSGVVAKYAATSQAITNLTFVNGGGDPVTGDSTGSVTNTTASDAAASLTLTANALKGGVGNTTLTFTLGYAMASGDTVVFVAPNNLDVTNVSFYSETFAGAGTFSGCTDSGQTITCTADGAITAGTGTIVLRGITANSEGTSKTITSLAVNDDSAGGADISSDASGAVTNTYTGGKTQTVTVAQYSNVTGLKAADSAEGVVLTWDDSVSEAAGYVDIYRGFGSPELVNGNVYARVDRGVKTFTDKNVKTGDKMAYLVKAVGTSGTSTGAGVTYTVGSPATTTETPATTTETTTGATEEATTTEATEEATTTSEETEKATELKDVATHWAKDVIEKAQAMEIVKGDPDGNFRPDAGLNRAEAAAIMGRVLGLDGAVVDAAPFTDVEKGIWFGGYVAKLKELGVVKGNPDGTFEGVEAINRAEFLKLAMEAYFYGNAEKKAEFDAMDMTKMENPFADLDSKAWYAKYVLVGAKWGFVAGSDCDGKKCFNAERGITRAEAVKIVINIFGTETKVEEAMPEDAKTEEATEKTTEEVAS
jgi:hypothetical protein